MKINKTIFYFFLLFPFFKSDIVTDLNKLKWLDNLYDIWKITSILVMTYFWIKLKKIDIKLFILLGLTASTILSAILNGNTGNIISYINVQISVIFIGVLVYLARDNNDIKYLLKAAYILLAVYCIGNLISVIIFAPAGAMYIPDSTGIITKDRYLLGSKNYQVLFIFPFIGISSICDLYCHDKIRKRTIILQVLSIIPLLVTTATTAIVGIAVYYMLYVILCKVKWSARYLNEVTIIGVNLAAFVFLIVLDGQRYFSDLFMVLFHKNLQSQRAYIWQKYLDAVANKLLMGYGQMSYWERRMSVGVVHAHNQYLDMIYQGGLVGIGIFIFLIWFSLHKLRGNKIKFIISASIMTWLVMFQSEYYYTNLGFYMFLFLCFDWNELKEREKG